MRLEPKVREENKDSLTFTGEEQQHCHLFVKNQDHKLISVPLPQENARSHATMPTGPLSTLTLSPHIKTHTKEKVLVSWVWRRYKGPGHMSPWQAVEPGPGAH